MKYYPPVLTILRFVAVSVFLFYSYRLLSSALTFYPEPLGRDEGMQRMLQFGKNQTMVFSAKTIVAGIALYFLAPLLSRIITVGADSR